MGLQQVAGCTDGQTCPGVWIDNKTGEVVIRGPVVAGLPLADGEQTVKLPPGMLAEAAARL